MNFCGVFDSIFIPPVVGLLNVVVYRYDGGQGLVRGGRALARGRFMRNRLMKLPGKKKKKFVVRYRLVHDAAISVCIHMKYLAILFQPYM